jgi:hypothetical protein
MFQRFVAAVFVIGMTICSWASPQSKVPITGVELQLTSSAVRGQLHWKIINHSQSSVFVYSFFLYGPAYGRETKDGKEIFDTAPISDDKGTVNHFPPVLLLMVPAGDYREGDFRDPDLKNLGGKTVSLKIGIGANPYSVVEEANRLRRGQGQIRERNPYNAIFSWATILESNSVQLSE